MNAFEWQLFHIDQRINDRGLPVDLDFCKAAAKASKALIASEEAKAKELSKVDNPRSVKQMVAWANEMGLEIDNMQRATVDKLLADPELDPIVRKVLAARQQFRATSLKKYDEILKSHVNGRMKGCFKYFGAHTGRWSGQRLQPQNLPRGSLKPGELDTARNVVLESPELLSMLYDDPAGVLSSLIRSTIIAPRGEKLVVADYRSIETVILAWLAGGRMLDVLRAGRDIYIDFATRLFSCAYEEVTPAQRTFAKPAVLGRGYGLGATGLRRYATMYGLEMDDETAAAHIQAYDNAYPEVRWLWDRLRNMSFEVVVNRGSSATGNGLTFRTDSVYMYIDLPSNRTLCYRAPRVKLVKKGWGEVNEIRYIDGHKRVEVGTWYGKLTENVVQALARDVLAHGLVNAEVCSELTVIGHVHDEIICLAKYTCDDAIARLTACMVAPEWCADAPIEVEAWEGERYRKG